MEIIEQKQRYVNILKITGRLDTATYKIAEEKMSGFLARNEKWYLIDLSELSYISSSGLRVLLQVLKQAKTMKGTVVLSGLNESIKEVFTISGFNSFFEIFESVEEGMKYFV